MLPQLPTTGGEALVAIPLEPLDGKGPHPDDPCPLVIPEPVASTFISASASPPAST